MTFKNAVKLSRAESDQALWFFNMVKQPYNHSFLQWQKLTNQLYDTILYLEGI